MTSQHSHRHVPSAEGGSHPGATPLYELDADPLSRQRPRSPLRDSPGVLPENAFRDAAATPRPFGFSKAGAAVPSPIITSGINRPGSAATQAAWATRYGSGHEGDEKRPTSPHITTTLARHSTTSPRRSSYPHGPLSAHPPRQGSGSDAATPSPTSANAGFRARAAATAQSIMGVVTGRSSPITLFSEEPEDFDPDHAVGDDERGKGHGSAARRTPSLRDPKKRGEGTRSPFSAFSSAKKGRGMRVDVSTASNGSAGMYEGEGRKTPAQYRPSGDIPAPKKGWAEYYAADEEGTSPYVAPYGKSASGAYMGPVQPHPLSHGHSASLASISSSTEGGSKPHSLSINMTPPLAPNVAGFEVRPDGSPIFNGSPIVVPQARRGAINLRNGKRSGKGGKRAKAAKRRAAAAGASAGRLPKQPLHIRLISWVQFLVHAIFHPIHTARSLRCQASDFAKRTDEAFRCPTTGQRTLRPPWMGAYIPLLIWLVISLSSTFCVLIWHTEVFTALDELATTLQSWGLKGRLIMGALIFITTFPPLPLYSTLIILSGFAFGLVQGFIISYIAALSGAILVFLLSRGLLKNWMVKLLNRSGGLKKVVRAIEKQPKLLFLVRLAPYPYNLMNTLLASSPTLTLRTYTLCTALALPKLLVHCGLGTTIKNFAAYNGAGAGSKAGADTGEDLTKASHTAETVKHVAGFVGVGLCIGIFIYLFNVASSAVEELDSDDEDGYAEIATSEDEEDTEDEQEEELDDHSSLDEDPLSVGGSGQSLGSASRVTSAGNHVSFEMHEKEGLARSHTPRAPAGSLGRSSSAAARRAYVMGSSPSDLTLVEPAMALASASTPSSGSGSSSHTTSVGGSTRASADTASSSTHVSFSSHSLGSFAGHHGAAKDGNKCSVLDVLQLEDQAQEMEEEHTRRRQEDHHRHQD